MKKNNQKLVVEFLRKNGISGKSVFFFIHNMVGKRAVISIKTEDFSWITIGLNVESTVFGRESFVPNFSSIRKSDIDFDFFWDIEKNTNVRTSSAANIKNGDVFAYDGSCSAYLYLSSDGLVESVKIDDESLNFLSEKRRGWVKQAVDSLVKFSVTNVLSA